MKLRVLGCAGAEFPGRYPSAFLVDDSLLLDAGTVGAVLTEAEQLAIRRVLVTHAHLDHVRGMPLLADNLVVRGDAREVQIVGMEETLQAIRKHLLNDVIWPDFSKIPSEADPIIRYLPIEPQRQVQLGPFCVTAFPVHHAVPAVGYRVSRGGRSLLYTGDTGPTDLIWREAGPVSALIVEVSFPDRLEELALITGHLTPRLLAGELQKLPQLPQRIFITHLKEQHLEAITGELEALRLPGVEILKDGAVYHL